jgi:hypothetical protein
MSDLVITIVFALAFGFCAGTIYFNMRRTVSNLWMLWRRVIVLEIKVESLIKAEEKTNEKKEG